MHDGLDTTHLCGIIPPWTPPAPAKLAERLTASVTRALIAIVVSLTNRNLYWQIRELEASLRLRPTLR